MRRAPRPTQRPPKKNRLMDGVRPRPRLPRRRRPPLPLRKDHSRELRQDFSPGILLKRRRLLPGRGEPIRAEPRQRPFRLRLCRHLPPQGRELIKAGRIRVRDPMRRLHIMERRHRVRRAGRIAWRLQVLARMDRRRRPILFLLLRRPLILAQFLLVLPSLPAWRPDIIPCRLRVRADPQAWDREADGAPCPPFPLAHGPGVLYGQRFLSPG